MMRYEYGVKCKSCGYVCGSDMDAKFYNAFDKYRLCGDCGSTEGWRDAVVFWEGWSCWWKPWTWGSGRWLERGSGL